MHHQTWILCVALVGCMLLALPSFGLAGESSKEPLTLIVMDPLAAPLACDCVQGYAQRKYEKLAGFLEARLDRRVDVFWTESLAEALKEKSDGKASIVIGKYSVVRMAAVECELSLAEVARLSGSDGSVMEHGLLVVRTNDSAKELSDLKDYRIFFGTNDADEKFAAPKALLTKHGVPLPKSPETFPACSSAATALVELDADVKAAAVISSYAKPLLEGCGAVNRGDLRVLGRTADVPFISAFINKGLAAELQSQIQNELLAVGEHAGLLLALETDHGFELPPAEWPCWRGSNRDALVPKLPSTLPAEPDYAWEARLPSDGIGGIAAAEGVVVVGGRDLLDTQDVFRCYDQESGALVWQYACLVSGELDYGNSPRATPVITTTRVFLQGAFGHVSCVDRAKGDLLWSKHMVKDFHAPKMHWGYSGSPLLIDGKLIIQPGSQQASLVALDEKTGETIWKSPGIKSGYGSFTTAAPNGVKQIVGFDSDSLGGWDPGTGQRLWKVDPPRTGDFNVQTPVIFEGQVIVSTETNGTQAYRFDTEGKLLPTPVSSFSYLAPDSHTPIVVDGKIYGVSDGLFCLDARDGLKELWSNDDDAFYTYASLIGGQERLLLLSIEGELLLIKGSDKNCQVESRLKLTNPMGKDVYAHPALVGKRLFARIGKRLVRLDLP